MKLTLVSFIARLILLHVAIGSSDSDEQQYQEAESCTAPADTSQVSSLLQRASKRESKGALHIGQQPIEHTDVEILDEDDVFCSWRPADPCKQFFKYKGVVYSSCASVDHPTPWCSHSEEHMGAWSACTRRCKNISMYSAGVGVTATGASKASLSAEECSAPLVRFAAINDILAVKPIKEGADPFFPAEESSIAPTGTSCGDTAQGIFESCAKYNSWETMDSISKTNGFAFSVFDPSKGVPLFTDIEQGQLGTCYFLAALASVAYQAPELIQDMFVRREYWNQGILSTRWIINGMESIVEVDKTIPAKDGKAYFTTFSEDSGAWWPAILEKAWSKIYGSYKSAEAGLWAVAASAITRAPTVTYDLSEVQGTELWTTLVVATAKKWPMGASTEKSLYGLAAGHAYTVLEAWEDPERGKLVKVRNPWRTNFYEGSQPNPNYGDDSGIFTMSFPEFEVAFSSHSVAKVHPSYEVSSLRVVETSGGIQGTFRFTTRSAKWFAVSIVWPNHRMLCKMPNPSYTLAVQKDGSKKIFRPEPIAYASNAVYVEIPEGADGGPGTYNVVLNADFPLNTFIHDIYLNVYAEAKIDIAPSSADYATMLLSMIGPVAQGTHCSIVTIKGRGLWKTNKANLMYGAPTFDSWDGQHFAYYVGASDEWFLIKKDKWAAVQQGKQWHYAKVTTEDFVCGCQDSDTGIGGFTGVGCDRVKAPSLKYGNVRCDAAVQYTALVQAYCPVTCGVDVCRVVSS